MSCIEPGCPIEARVVQSGSHFELQCHFVECTRGQDFVWPISSPHLRDHQVGNDSSVLFIPLGSHARRYALRKIERGGRGGRESTQPQGSSAEDGEQDRDDLSGTEEPVGDGGRRGRGWVVEDRGDGP